MFHESGPTRYGTDFLLPSTTRLGFAASLVDVCFLADALAPVTDDKEDNLEVDVAEADAIRPDPTLEYDDDV